MAPLKVLLVLAAMSGASSKVIYPVNEADDPEIKEDWTTPKDRYYYRSFTAWATYVGNMLAGRSEFPFLVRIQSTDLDVEKWGVGNLVTLTHVLCTARQVDFVLDSFEVDPEQGVDEGLVLSLEYITVRILYCAQYLYEDYQFNNKIRFEGYDMFDHDVHESGARYVRFMYKHGWYSTDHITYDIGIMRTNYPIRPLPPLQDWMPIWFDWERRPEPKITDVDLSKMIAQRRICYIASFGSQWLNNDSPIEIYNYKIRLRAYWRKLADCNKHINFYQRTFENQPLQYVKKDEKNLMCFETRARVGSICDHDRGAPLVCDGRVYGFVARSVEFDYCNNRLPFPFFVLKAAALDRYYLRISEQVFLPFRTPENFDQNIKTKIKKSESGRKFACGYTVIFSLLVSFWAGRTQYHHLNQKNHNYLLN